MMAGVGPRVWSVLHAHDKSLLMDPFDIVVVGGGINGAGIARDAVGRGLSVLLCERDDLAAHTSSASTKLIHGGLRYLEQFEFALVGKALAEREVLLRAAPHIIWPLRFVLPHQPHLRPAWMIRLGLFLYDHLGRGRRTLPGSRRIRFAKHVAGQPLREEFHTGFVYSDAWVQDARMVVLNAMDAAYRGAEILTHTRCVAAVREGEWWRVELESAQGHRTIHARSLVNATGPWAATFLGEVADVRHDHALRLVKGSHIVVPKLFDHRYAYIFQQPDRRIVFAIPYEREFTLIGTTDVEYHGDPSQPRIDADETTYLCEAANRYFRKELAPSDVVWSYSGVRPLLDDENTSASEVTRDYLLEVDADGPPLLNVFGGKITTFRKLAEEAVDQLAPLLGSSVGPWTSTGRHLPGGGEPDIDELLVDVRADRPWLNDAMADRLVRTYGTRCRDFLGAAASLADLGEHFGGDLYAAEVDYLVRHEWARHAEDILWRRTKTGLHVDAAGAARLDAYISTRLAAIR